MYEVWCVYMNTHGISDAITFHILINASDNWMLMRP